MIHDLFKMHAEGVRYGTLLEFPLYSDADLAGSFELGPVDLLPGFSWKQEGFRVCWFARVAGYDQEVPPMTKTDLERFTGTRHPVDDLAALLSLLLGARVISGDFTRGWYARDRNQFGDPREDAAMPVWGARSATRTMIPSALGRKALTDESVGLLKSLRQLDLETTVRLVRAARAYRDGLRVADDSPEIAWLLFVTAVEVAAMSLADDEPETVMRSHADKKYKSLVAYLDPLAANAVKVVAEHYKDLSGSTGRFKKFFRQFPVEPPEPRPAPHLRCDWTKLRVMLEEVYRMRSRALHAGIAFPPALCEPGRSYEGNEREECPSGIAESRRGGVWHFEEDVRPMTMHVFEHVVRSALTQWWKSLPLAPPARERPSPEWRWLVPQGGPTPLEPE